MQQEIKKQRNLGTKDRELNQKDREPVRKDKDLNIERRLWKNREVDWDPRYSTVLHRIEMFDSVIPDESRQILRPCAAGNNSGRA